MRRREAVQHAMDGGFRGAQAQLAVRARLLRAGGGIVRTERVPGVGAKAVMCEERELRRLTQAERGETVTNRTASSQFLWGEVAVIGENPLMRN